MVMVKLRAKNGCPWDRKQTSQSIKRYLLEEAYEAFDAISQKDWAGFQEELGDLLFQVVFHSQMAQEEGKFALPDVLATVKQKLIDRHPHVFGNEIVRTAKEQSKKWEEYKGIKDPVSLLERVPKSMASLPQAFSLQERAARLGFDWETVEGVEEKLNEELAEWHAAVKSKKKKRKLDELGDLLFTVVNLARWHGLDPDVALRDSNRKFRNRFAGLNRLLKKKKRTLKECSPEELERLWQKVKKRGA